jgi:predicted nucleotidyltransferase
MHPWCRVVAPRTELLEVRRGGAIPLGCRCEVRDKAMAANARAQTQIQEMVDRIVREFKPERVILFGSYAHGEAGPDSDVDLLVVMDVKGSRRQARLAIRRALHDIRMPKDIIVTTPEDFEWRKEVAGTIERPAAQGGEVLYART